MPHIALYQPDIPQNVGSIIRLSACLGAPLSIIEPCGFVFDQRKIRRVALDYYDHASITRHTSWTAFRAWQAACKARLVLFTTKSRTPYTAFAFAENDILLFGRESSGVPEEVVQAADARLLIPLQPAARSLNVALTAAIGLSEALRQTNAKGAAHGH